MHPLVHTRIIYIIFFYLFRPQGITYTDLRFPDSTIDMDQFSKMLEDNPDESERFKDSLGNLVNATAAATSIPSTISAAYYTTAAAASADSTTSAPDYNPKLKKMEEGNEQNPDRDNLVVQRQPHWNTATAAGQGLLQQDHHYQQQSQPSNLACNGTNTLTNSTSTPSCCVTPLITYTTPIPSTTSAAATPITSSTTSAAYYTTAAAFEAATTAAASITAAASTTSAPCYNPKKVLMNKYTNSTSPATANITAPKSTSPGADHNTLELEIADALLQLQSTPVAPPEPPPPPIEAIKVKEESPTSFEESQLEPSKDEDKENHHPTSYNHIVSQYLQKSAFFGKRGEVALCTPNTFRVCAR